MLYLITLATGMTMHFTNIDRDVVFGGNTYQANAVLIDGLKYKCATGLEVDKQQLTIAAWLTQTLNGAPVLQALAGGAFDGAHVQRYRVFIDPVASRRRGRRLGVPGPRLDGRQRRSDASQDHRRQ